MKDFKSLPRLSYGKAAAATTLLGLLMVLVLSMISGARELLTPAAWHRQGIAYQLAEGAPESVRQRGLDDLRGSLFAYASTNNGTFPIHNFIAGIPEKIWQAVCRLQRDCDGAPGRMDVANE